MEFGHAIFCCYSSEIVTQSDEPRIGPKLLPAFFLCEREIVSQTDAITFLKGSQNLREEGRQRKADAPPALSAHRHLSDPLIGVAVTSLNGRRQRERIPCTVYQVTVYFVLRISEYSWYVGRCVSFLVCIKLRSTLPLGKYVLCKPLFANFLRLRSNLKCRRYQISCQIQIAVHVPVNIDMKLRSVSNSFRHSKEAVYRTSISVITVLSSSPRGTATVRAVFVPFFFGPGFSFVCWNVRVRF